MEKQYYTPDVSDLFIGYECEYLIGTTPKTELYKDTIIKGVFEDILFLEGNIKIDSSSKIRTPYLSKEDIEKEGWKVTNRELKPAPYKVDWVNASKGKYSLSINFALIDKMFITIYGNRKEVIYKGECKSINEFRKIMKWLKIS